MASVSNRVTPGEQLMGLSGLALFAVSFLPWVGAKVESIQLHGVSIPAGSRYHFQDTAWDHGATFVAVLIGLGLAGYVGLRLLGLVAAPRRATLPQLMAVCAAVAFLLVLIQLFAGAHADLASFGLPSTANLVAVKVSIVKTRSAGIYAGLVATIGLGVGGYLTLRGT